MKRVPLLNYSGKYAQFAPRFRQLELESESWKRLLSFLSDENVRLKTRFALALKNYNDKRFLNKLEQFNDSFISQDELIKLMRKEVAGIDEIISRQNIIEQEQFQLLEKKVANLRNNIQVAEEQFADLRRQFDQFQYDSTFGLR